MVHVVRTTKIPLLAYSYCFDVFYYCTHAKRKGNSHTIGPDSYLTAASLAHSAALPLFVERSAATDSRRALITCACGNFWEGSRAENSEYRAW